MSRILNSIDSNLIGRDSLGRLIAKDGFRAGDHGKQIDLPSVKTVSFFDDFLGDVIADQWNYVEGTGNPADAAVLAGGIGGVLRVTTGAAGTGLAADLSQMTQALQWQASNGGLTLQARLKLSAITTCYVFIGFTDVATLEAPIESANSANTLTSNASDAVGFMFDTRMTNDTWWLVGVKADTDATHQNTGYAPVADDYATFRIELTSTGAADFFYNGVQVGTRMSAAITATTDLTPTLAVGKTSVAAGMTMDVDYAHVSMLRAADGDAT